MSLYIEPKNDFQGITFVHIPKCAGSSIKHTLKEHFPKSIDTHFHHGIGNKNLKTYWSFAVFRNPYDRALSMYNEVWNVLQTKPKTLEKITKFSALDIQQNLTFDKFVMEWFNQTINGIKPSKQQIKYISDDSGIIVDKVIPYTRLAEHWPEIEDRCGKTMPLPNLRVGKYRSIVWDAATKKVINEYYRQDIQYWESIR